MSVHVIDTIKPKNNLGFPVVEAVDVEVSEGLRLPEALAAKADASALATTNAAVATKANTAEVNSSLSNLQGQINQIEISATAEAIVAPEVAAARVSYDGTEYTTLNARLDAENTQVNKGIGSLATNVFASKSITSSEAGSWLSTGGTQLPNNRLYLFATTAGRKVEKGVTFTVATNDIATRVDFKFTSTGGTTESTGWLNVPQTFTVPDDGKVQLLFAKSSDNVAFSSVSEIDGIVSESVRKCINEFEMQSNIANVTDNINYSFIRNYGAKAASPLVQEYEADWSSAIIPCTVGDTFRIKGFGASTWKLWTFTDSNGNILTQSASGVHATDFVYLEAPADATYLTVNSKYTEIEGVCVKGTYAKKDITTLQNEMSAISDIVYHFPTAAETGATLSSGGTLTPNNRLHFYGYDSKSLKVSKGSQIFISARDGNRVAFVFTPTGGSAIDSGWLPLPNSFIATEEGSLRVVFARDVDTHSFDSVSDMDGTVKTYVFSEEVENNYYEIKKKIDNAQCKATKHVTFAHISDIHGDAAALNRFYDRCQKYDAIDAFICTGDIVPNTSASAPITDWWIPQIMTTIGNHDTATISDGVYDWTALSMADRDTYYIAPFESNWGIQHTSGTSYYYKDYASQNLRLIVLDTMLYASDETADEADVQTQWYEDLLDSAITNGYHVIVATHSGRGDNVECSFSSYESATTPAYALPEALYEMVDSKITGGLCFVGYLCGHTHQDNIFVYTGTHKQYSYCITCANVVQAAQWAYSDQHRSTTEDAWNIVTIDTINSLVKIIRDGGADIDRYLRPRNTITINYETGDIIQSN